MSNEYGPNPTGGWRPPAAPAVMPPAQDASYGPPAYPQSPSFPPVAPPPAKKLPLPVYIAVFTLVVIITVGYFLFRVSGPNILQKAQETCHTGTLSDGNKTLLFDMAGEDVGSGTGSYADYQCLTTALDVPQSVQSKMGETRALDGRQSDSWKTENGTKLNASWSYHPDDGLDMIVELDD